jgi:leucyl aminopeptidase
VLASRAAALCKTHKIRCTVWDHKQIQANGMKLLHAVGRGSRNEPRFVHMVYTPAGPAKKGRKKLVVVGKGLTFDSGGLCIKTAKGMADMKCDMSGAAATIGIVQAAAKLAIPVEVHGVLGCVENMSGDHAYRPGDVFPSREGKTVEIINTDAEGRLVLADVLAYGAELSPDYMIDHATLTGACMVALGRYCAGLYANDDELGGRYLDAARTAGERFWRMPLLDDLRETLKSDVADLKHTGDQYGGSITAALFLREFVGKTKWIHNDIAGPAFLEGAHETAPKGGTGFGVATGAGFLEALASG